MSNSKFSWPSARYFSVSSRFLRGWPRLCLKTNLSVWVGEPDLLDHLPPGMLKSSEDMVEFSEEVVKFSEDMVYFVKLRLWVVGSGILKIVDSCGVILLDRRVDQSRLLDEVVW